MVKEDFSAAEQGLIKRVMCYSQCNSPWNLSCNETSIGLIRIVPRSRHIWSTIFLEERIFSNPIALFSFPLLIIREFNLWHITLCGLCGLCGFRHFLLWCLWLVCRTRSCPGFLTALLHCPPQFVDFLYIACKSWRLLHVRISKSWTGESSCDKFRKRLTSVNIKKIHPASPSQ